MSQSDSSGGHESKEIVLKSRNSKQSDVTPTKDDTYQDNYPLWSNLPHLRN